MGAKRWVWWVLPATLLIAGCTGGRSASDPTPTGAESRSAASPVVPPPSAPSSAPGSGTATSRSATPTTRPTATPVPVDQIPPGNPESWVPAGVPTTAPYREPGDVVPKFTRTMFQNSSDGALAMAHYYIDAQNWAVAVNDFHSAGIICDAKRCDLLQQYFDQLRASGLHLIGDRSVEDSVRIVAGPNQSQAEWVVQLSVVRSKSAEVGTSGKKGKIYPKQILPTNLYMRWNGRLWRVADDAND